MVFRVIVEFDLTIGTDLYQQSDNVWSDVGTLHHDIILDKLTLYTLWYYSCRFLSQWKGSNIFQFPGKLVWFRCCQADRAAESLFFFASEANFGDANISWVFVKHHHARNLCSYVCRSRYVWVLFLFGTCYVLYVCNHCSCATFFKRCLACHPLLQVFHEAQSEMVLAQNSAIKQEPLHF